MDHQRITQQPLGLYYGMLLLRCDDNDDDDDNKSAHSNLGRGPRRGTVAHVRRKVAIGYNGVPQIRPQKYPFPWADP